MAGNLTTDPRGIGIQEVQRYLEKTFPGLKIRVPQSMGGNSFHAEATFFEYEIRVILTGPRTKDRQINFRFMQKVEHADNRRPTKRMVFDVETTDPDDLEKAIDDTAAYLRGVVFAIQKAFQPPKGTRSVDDLFLEDDA